MSQQDTPDRFTAMRGTPLRSASEATSAGAAHSHHDHLLERLIDRLPGRWRTGIRWLRDPSARWARIPAGVLFIIGGFLFILPILGLWMVPLGLILLAEDVPLLRRLRDRTLDWIERRRPHWFGGEHKQISDKEGTT